MRIDDFDRIGIYKLYLPILYIINWVLMYIGPAYYPAFYEKYYILAAAYLTCRTTFSCIWTYIGSVKAHKLMDRIQKQRSVEAKQLVELKTGASTRAQKYQVEHLFVIPNYNQEEEVLAQTIQEICRHSQAKKRYSIFLAMEDHQPNAEAKAKKLIAKYKNKLKFMGYTLHELRKFEQRGKAANVSWCVESLQQYYFNPMKIKKEQVILTILDADSWVPHLYIKQVNRHIASNFQGLHSFIFQPCQMFTRNQFQVPFVVRYYDVAHGLVHFSNLYSVFGASFPLSNYSLSYKLAEKIGFWDTCPEAIGQDFHTTIKAFWKTNGKITTIPIFTPFNQLSIHTGKGFWTDVSKRFWQAQRHGRGCADAAYNIKNIIQKRVNWRTLLIAFQALEIMTMPAILPWCLTTVGLFRVFSSFNGDTTYVGTQMNNYNVGWLFNICSLMAAIMYICYDSVCRRASKLYYKASAKQNLENWIDWLMRFVSYNLVFFVCIFTITIPSVTIAVFRVVWGKNVYETAQKKLADKNEELLLQR